jgi:hypothetical protein
MVQVSGAVADDVERRALRAVRRRERRNELAEVRARDRKYRVHEYDEPPIVIPIDAAMPLTHAQAERMFERMRREVWSQPGYVTGWAGCVT